jgi:hypothetical protein
MFAGQTGVRTLQIGRSVISESSSTRAVRRENGGCRLRGEIAEIGASFPFTCRTMNALKAMTVKTCTSEGHSHRDLAQYQLVPLFDWVATNFTQYRTTRIVSRYHLVISAVQVNSEHVVQVRNLSDRVKRDTVAIYTHSPRTMHMKCMTNMNHPSQCSKT